MHSTELAALETIDRIIDDLDKGETPINIYLDLSKAFDTLNHDILISKLQYYGIKGSELNLLKQYLSNRKQYVSYENTNSAVSNISTGVPQGSILGPLLFLIYINDMVNASDAFQLIMYADDSNLSSTLKSFGREKNSHINSELDKISEWLKVNELSLNIKKTKFMVFYMPQKRIIIPKLRIEGTQIECVDNFNYLGIILNEHLKWKSHIDKIAIKVSRSIGIMNRLKSYIPQDILLTIYNTLILPHYNYGLLCWGYESSRMFKLQKKAMRIIGKTKYNSHSEPIFKQFGILKIEDMLKLKQLKYYYDLTNNNIPVYFKSIPMMKNMDVHGYNTRQKHDLHTRKIKHEFTKKRLRYDYIIEQVTR